MVIVPPHASTSINGESKGLRAGAATMKQRYALILCTVALAAAAALWGLRWQVGESLHPPGPSDANQWPSDRLPGSDLRRMPENSASSQGRPAPRSPRPVDFVAPPVDFPPLIPAPPAAPQDTGPFIDADAERWTPPSGSELDVPRDTGPFIDADADPRALASQSPQPSDSVPQDTGPFVDADPRALSSQPPEDEPVPQDTGPFIDAEPPGAPTNWPSPQSPIGWR